MRKLGSTLLVCSMMMVPFAALSQESAAPSPDEFVCALTGECGDEAVNLVYAIPFEPQDYAPTLAEALRRAAESDIEYHGRQAAAGRAVLALAEELAATPAKAQ